jgi:hypothetical protein
MLRLGLGLGLEECIYIWKGNMALRRPNLSSRIVSCLPIFRAVLGPPCWGCVPSPVRLSCRAGAWHDSLCVGGLYWFRAFWGYVHAAGPSSLAHVQICISEQWEVGLLFLFTIYIQIHTHLKWGGYG